MRSLWRQYMKITFRNSSTNRGGARCNPLGIQMLTESLHKQIFGSEKDTFSKETIDYSLAHLSHHGVQIGGHMTSLLHDVDITLPPLQGNNLNDHFLSIAQSQLDPYLSLINCLIEQDLPSPPTRWNYNVGWTQYDCYGKPHPVPYPDEQALVLDVEVCVTEGHAPTLAVAASPNYWYSWVSKRLIEEQDYIQRSKVTLNDLISLEGLSPQNWREQLIVGHNISYDRARIKEQYLFKGPRTKFLDTLSIHVCVSGQTSLQKHKWQSIYGRRNIDDVIMTEDNDIDGWSIKHRASRPSKWMNVSSPNSLADVYQLYCGGSPIDKSPRDIFVTGSITDIRENFQMLMSYCSEDVYHTHQVLQVVYPLFQQHCPHPVTLAGMLEMGSMYLPVNVSWNRYLQSSRYTAEDLEIELTNKLMTLANEACMYMQNERYRNDVWLSNLDWSSKQLRKKGKTIKQMKHLLENIRKINEQYIEEFTLMEDKPDDLYQFIISNSAPKIKKGVHKPGYPNWYRQLCLNINYSPWQSGPVLISPQMRVVPYLLRMKWEGHPLYYHTSLGWGYIVPVTLHRNQIGQWGPEDVINYTTLAVTPTFDDVEELLIRTENSSQTPQDGMVSGGTMELMNSDRCVQEVVPMNFGCGLLESKSASLKKRSRVTTEFGISDDIVILGGDQYYYFKLPHKNGSEACCGNPLSKDYLPKMEAGYLTSAAGELGQRILELNSMGSFWKGALWTNENDVLNQKEEEGGVILPITMVSGTVTRRAVEPTWLTASNAKESRVGSELKAMIQAPPSYHIVGADVDSQELWIASILGDVHFTGMHGSTAFGWMNLQGNKSDGSDLHSKTAQTIGITREQAKIFNYGRIYGAGRPFSELLLKQFNPSLNEKEIQQKSSSLYSTTKGERRILLTIRGQERAQEAGISVRDDGSVKKSDWYNKFNNRQTRGVVLGQYWSGGTESAMFNKLESIALSTEPRTPILNCQISRALDPQNVGNEFMTSRINWVVQSSAVDYLHLLLVSMRWLLDWYNIKGRLCISIHDEVRYLVASEERYKCALALQIANLWTRSMFAYQLGMRDLPLGVAFFSAVDIDTVLRKEVTMDCKTPSNPLGLKEGHGIPYGEALDILQVLQKIKDENK